jgi:hypothetical protein
MKNQTTSNRTEKPTNPPAFTKIVVGSLFKHERPLAQKIKPVNEISFEALNRIFNKK